MIGIVNYGAGEHLFADFSVRPVGPAFGMINTEADLDKYTHIIIPGVGHAGACHE